MTCCGSTPSAYIRNTPKGISINCFRCGAREFEPHDDRSIQEILAARRGAVDDVRKLYGMPKEAVKLQDSGNAYAMTWVLKAGITPERASDQYGMRWSEKLERVLLPIHNTAKEYTGLIGRSVSASVKPKYLLLQGAPLAYFMPVISDTVVVTEDILSTIVVQESGTTSYAALGTAVKNEFVDMLSKFENVIGWFDPDGPGQKAQNQLRRRLAMHDKTMLDMRSDVDPKYIPRHDIRNRINERLLNDRP